MDIERIQQVYELDREGKHDDAFDLLLVLVEANDPMAHFELSSRYFSTVDREPPVLEIPPDYELSKNYSSRGRLALRDLADKGDGEAMRMLAYAYLGHLCPGMKNPEKAEDWLLKSLASGCDIAANDLSTYYRNIDLDKSKYWYEYAEKCGCRVISDPTLEE